MTDLNWVLIQTYQTTDYVNLTKALIRNAELQGMAKEYFSNMTKPTIPNEEGVCVYAHDWESFIRWASWKLQNPDVTNMQDVWQIEQK